MDLDKIIAALVVAAGIICLNWYLLYQDQAGLTQTEKTDKVIRQLDWRFDLRKCSKWSIIMVALLDAAMIVSAVIVYTNVVNLINFVKLMTLWVVIAGSAVIDMKKRIIPNVLLLAGLAVRVVIYILEYILYPEVFRAILISDGLGFLVGFGVFFISAVITRGAIGFGDVKLFGLIGLTTGFICTYATMLYCLLASTAVSVVLMILRKKGRKDSIPFGPCVMIGYFITLILSNY